MFVLFWPMKQGDLRIYPIDECKPGSLIQNWLATGMGSTLKPKIIGALLFAVATNPFVCDGQK